MPPKRKRDSCQVLPTPKKKFNPSTPNETPVKSDVSLKKRSSLKTSKSAATNKDSKSYRFPDGKLVDISQYHLVNSYKFADEKEKEVAITLEHAWNAELDVCLQEFLEEYEEPYEIGQGSWFSLISSFVKGPSLPKLATKPRENVQSEVSGKIDPTPQNQSTDISPNNKKVAKAVWDCFKEKFRDDLEVFRKEVLANDREIPADYSSRDVINLITTLLE